MRFRALVTDYDGTLATHGRVFPATIAALERCRASGCLLVLVTGRILSELEEIFPQLAVFDVIVGENGAVIRHPRQGDGEVVDEVLAPPPSPALASTLRARGIDVACGRVIVATWEPHLDEVHAAVAELGLRVEIILNKDALMVLPEGIDKVSGLTRAMRDEGVSLDDCVAVGDGENDIPMLAACGVGVAVANALDIVKQSAAWVTASTHGEGVVEVIDAMLSGELAQATRAGRGA